MDPITHLHILAEPSILNPEYWSYKGEGNANLILSYQGPDSLYENTILRLKKIEKEENKSKTQDDSYTENLEFIDTVIGPLIGLNYVGKMLLCELQSDFLTELSKKIELDRPESRRFKTIDIKERIGLICSDHTKLSSALFPPEHVISIEIKPKWGFLPNSEYISDCNQLKRKVCRYCMHQYLKYQKNPDIQTRSHFCPLDLYSKDKKRVKRSLECLIDTPQNNLKINLNDRRISFEQEEDILRVESSLGINDSKSEPETRKERVIDLLSSAVTKALLHDGILEKLKKLQSTLDETDIEGVFQIYDNLTEEEKLELTSKPLDWEPVVKRYMLRMDRGTELPERQNLSKEEKFQRIYEFMVSTTLKDCSVMLTLISSKFMPSQKRHLTDAVFSSFEVNDHQFLYKTKK
ncbi:hypothetical protein K7432_005471 [Basidiobolus ranarum]|uniref:Inositol-pentakisphosphate 2-kinase n=1 Tax=Basidiobolus ranarum TaxID=34480 RepID=A0ABR2WWF6_9FUNG